MNAASLIVLMTDFGTENWYDAAMKGEILRRAPQASILDLSHEVPRHEIEHAAFILNCAVDSFPRQTIFLCVVDPGVGGKRRGLVGRVGEYGYVGPDNGLVTPLMERSNGHFELFEIKAPNFRNPRVSNTFHGRDVFAPAAARLLLGDDPRLAGPRVHDPVLLPDITARESGAKVSGKVMIIDHFGNAVTNIDERRHAAALEGRSFELKVKTLRISEIHETFAAAPPGQPLCYWGSSGFLEIAINFGSAAETFSLRAGDPVELRLPV